MFVSDPQEVLYHATVRVGQKHSSNVVIVNAWHHRADGLSSLVALVGIGAARFGFPWMDPLAGLLVAAMIVRIGIRSAVDCIGDLTDKQVEGDLRDKFEELLRQQRGVLSFHKLRLRRMGAHVVADVHIVVDPFLSVSAAHQISERVRVSIMQAMPEIADMLVNVDVSSDADVEDSRQMVRPFFRVCKHGVRMCH